MKGIIHMSKSGTGVKDLQHNFRARATRSSPERSYENSRVFAVAGDARGDGVIMTKPGYERGMMAMLAGPNGCRKGKSARQAIFSCESMPNATVEEFNAALGTLTDVAKVWVDTFAPECRWVAIVHQDRHHPHVHIVVENWDYLHGGRRLDFSPQLLSKMQDMEWCKHLNIQPGKGSMGRINKGHQLQQSGMDLSTAKTWHQRVEICAWEAFSSRKEAAKSLLLWCEKKQPEKTVDGLLDALLGEPLPPGWGLKHKTKAGGKLRNPSVKIDGISLRLGSFLDVFAPNISRTKIRKKIIPVNPENILDSKV